jgi:hypothetical protein
MIQQAGLRNQKRTDPDGLLRRRNRGVVMKFNPHPLQHSIQKTDLLSSMPLSSTSATKSAMS